MMLGHVGSRVDWFAGPAAGVATVLFPPMEIEGDAATGGIHWSIGPPLHLDIGASNMGLLPPFGLPSLL